MSNNALTALIETGADAMSNMYDVTLEFADWNATVRAEGFKIPEIEAPTYDTKYHGVTYKRVKTEQNFDRKFSLTFRMDAKYGLYDSFTSLLAWHVDPNTGGVANANIGKVGKVTVRTLESVMIAANSTKAAELSGDGDVVGVDTYSGDQNPRIGQIPDSGTGIKTWAFEDVCVTKVAMPDFKTESADTMKFQVDFIFGNVSYPGFQAGAYQA